MKKNEENINRLKTEENLIRLRTIKDDLIDMYQIDIEQIKNVYSSTLCTKYAEFKDLVEHMIEYEENEFNNKVEYTTPMNIQKKWTDKDYKYFRKMNENGKVKSITYVVDKEMRKPVKADNIPW